MSRYEPTDDDLAAARAELKTVPYRYPHMPADQAVMTWTLDIVSLHLAHADEEPLTERATTLVTRARAALAAEQQWRAT